METVVIEKFGKKTMENALRVRESQDLQGFK